MPHAQTTFQRATPHLLILLLISLLGACGGGSNSGSGNSADRAAASDPTTPTIPPGDSIGDPGDGTPTPPAEHVVYTRPYDYPNMKSLPLQFFTTTSGKQLGVYVTLPADENGDPAPGPFPVILVQSAYNLSVSGGFPMKSGVLTGAPDPFMVKRGYAIVGVDVVGSGVSGGGWVMLGNEEHEGYSDAVDWVKQQPWFNGKLGLAGASYMAITALFTAEQRPDDVQAIFAGVPMGDAQRGTVGTGGMINGIFMSTWMTLTQMLTVQNIPAALLNPKYYSLIAANTGEHIDQIDSYYIPLIEKALNGDPEITYDSDFWRQRSPLEHIDNIKAPTIMFGALQDIFQRDEPLIYEHLKQNTDARLIIYNGDHIASIVNAYPGGNHVDPMMNLMLQWFDHYLKGMDTDTTSIPKVTQYVRNYSPLKGFGYATTTDWPHPEAQPERWYLRGDMSLDKTAPEADETTHSMTASEHADLVYGKNDAGNLLEFSIEIHDGTDCSPSYVQWTLGAAGIVKAPKCFLDNGELEASALNYQTAPMPEDYYINGPLEADIWMDTTAENAVLSVRIDDVNPATGAVEPITNGLLLASARAVDPQRSRYLYGEMIQPYHYFTQEAEMPVVPGEVFKMQVEIFPTSVLIRQGHQLRVSISPSNQAQGVLNLPRRAQVEGGITTIHTSPEYPSSLVVPVVPVSALN